MNRRYKEEVELKIKDKPHLCAVFSHALDIPKRVHEYNEHLFVIYNLQTDRFEIHSLESEQSYQCVLPYKNLDDRTIRYLWKNDIRVHGDEIFKRIEQSENRMEKEKERARKNWIEDVAKESRSLMAQATW